MDIMPDEERTFLLSFSLSTPTRRPYSLLLSADSTHPRSTEALRGPCAYATPLYLPPDFTSAVLYLQYQGHSRHELPLSKMEVLRALREERVLQVHLSMLQVSIYVEWHQPEYATLCTRFTFPVRVLVNSWRGSGPVVEGIAYIRRSNGSWRCVYRKGRCEAGDVVCWYGRERMEGVCMWVEGAVVRNGDVLYKGGGMIELREGRRARWEGGEVRVMGDVEGKGMVRVGLELMMEGRGWWRKWIRRKAQRIGALGTTL